MADLKLSQITTASGASYTPGPTDYIVGTGVGNTIDYLYSLSEIGSPGGSPGDIQYNKSGTFAGDPDFTTDGAGNLTFNSVNAGPGGFDSTTNSGHWTFFSNIVASGIDTDSIAPPSGSLTVLGNSGGGDTFKVDGSLVGSNLYANFWVIGDSQTYQIGTGNSAETSYGVPGVFFIFARQQGRMLLTAVPNFPFTGADTVALGAGGLLSWQSTTGAGFLSVPDVAFGRPSANTLELNNGTFTGFGGGGSYADLKLFDLFTNNTAFIARSAVTLANGASSSLGTLTNTPSAGNPTKWVPIDDNGTTRYIPAW